MRIPYYTLVAAIAVAGCSSSPSPVAEDGVDNAVLDVWMVQMSDGSFVRAFTEDEAIALMDGNPIGGMNGDPEAGGNRFNGDPGTGMMSLSLLKYHRLHGDPLGGQEVDNFVEERENPPIECWHWTHESGTWWVRHCGFTLSEECYYFSGPTGELRSCDEVGGGPGGNW